MVLADNFTGGGGPDDYGKIMPSSRCLLASCGYACLLFFVHFLHAFVPFFLRTKIQASVSCADFSTMLSCAGNAGGGVGGTGDPQQARALLAHTKAKGQALAGVEFGNGVRSIRPMPQ